MATERQLHGSELQAETVLHEADDVKRKGGASAQVGDLSATRRQVAMRHDLMRAMAQGQLRLEYQPIGRVSDGRVIGAEALVRWDHPIRGVVTPEIPTPLADRSAHCVNPGLWVLQQACIDRHRWSKSLDMGAFVIGVNVPARQLMAPNFGEMVTGVLTKTRTTASTVLLQITESALLRDAQRAFSVLDDLKERGVQLALDNFGKRFSSLTYLDLFPLDVVKLDRDVIAKPGADGLSQFITSKIVEFARLVCVDVIVEGVETARQHERVAELGVGLYQGSYLARAMSADKLDLFMS
jgi:EAL domain-containing protein (putative c-di-GMP-specific phosphodiesterase class I)